MLHKCIGRCSKRKNERTPYIGYYETRYTRQKNSPSDYRRVQAALKDVFEPMFEAMLNGEMESYLGCEPNFREEKETTNRRNSYPDQLKAIDVILNAPQVVRLFARSIGKTWKRIGS